jgi:hypothetical protein
MPSQFGSECALKVLEYVGVAYCIQERRQPPVPLVGMGAQHPWQLTGPRSLLAGHAVTVAIKLVDVLADHPHRALDISRSVAAAARAVDIAGDRDTGTTVVRVARGPGGPG